MVTYAGGFDPRAPLRPGPMADRRQQALGDVREQLREARHAPNTRAAYQKAWTAWERHCERAGIADPLAPAAAEVVDWFVRLGTEPSLLFSRGLERESMVCIGHLRRRVRPPRPAPSGTYG